MSKIPAVCECPHCGRMVSTTKRRFVTHSTFPAGPACVMSREPITEQIVTDTAHYRRMEQVLLWSHVLRDEDPRQVYGWIERCTRGELELLLLTALAGVNPDQTVRQAFSWVGELSR